MSVEASAIPCVPATYNMPQEIVPEKAKYCTFSCDTFLRFLSGFEAASA